MKLTHFWAGKKDQVTEVREVRFYNRFEDSLFAKPK